MFRIAPKALEIPELLGMILSFSTKEDCVAAARTARAWTSPALDRIWYELPALVHLFKLLGELELNEDYEFVRRPRMLVYTKRYRLSTDFQPIVLRKGTNTELLVALCPNSS